MVLTVVTANTSLWRRRHEANGRFLLLSLPILALLLALLISFKRYTYIILPLPFLALQIAYGLEVLVKWVGDNGRLWQWALALLLVFAFAEGMGLTIKNLQAARAATSYTDLTNEIRGYLPPQSKEANPKPSRSATGTRPGRSRSRWVIRSDPGPMWWRWRAGCRARIARSY
jgi:predicted PurR-regulated permease PerM